MFKQKSEPAAGTVKVEPADVVQQARTRARHRLIGAVVLLAIGIIGFPLVFETQPRPIPVDIPIEIPRRDSASPLVMPPARSTTPPATAPAVEPPSAPAAVPKEEIITESRADAGRDVTPQRVAVPAERAASRAGAASPAERAASRASAAPTPASEPAYRVAASASAAKAPDTKPNASGDGERARALLEGRPVAAATTAATATTGSAAADAQRFVVQVGAFADADAARETRKQVEKLGLKTYTQVAQTPSGNRIRVRVGPFASRVEADAALAKAKAAGLAAVVLSL
jgi:DedD protein